MSNALTMFANKGNLPAHVAKFLGNVEDNITDRVTVPSLSYEGKVWAIATNGDKTKLMKRDADGDEAPISTMRVVVLDYAKKRGRAYYEGAYDPGKVAAPLCWSDDGVAPDKSIKEPQCASCERCPMAVKGSKVTEQGKAVTACGQHRMLAVVPANNLGFTPLRLKIAITSDWDKQSPELQAAGWFAFNNYTDMLKANGCGHTAALVTKIKFDPNVAYPKLLFSADRWLDDREMAQVAPLITSDEVQKLLGGSWTPNGVDGTKVAPDADDEAAVAQAEAEVAKPKAAAKPKATKPKAEAAPATVQVPTDDDEDAVVTKPAKVMVMDDDDDVPATKPAKASSSVPEDVAALLADWDD